MPLTSMSIAQIAQSMPAIDKIDAHDASGLAVAIFLQVINLWAGDELFHLLAGIGSGCLVLLTGIRIAIKAYGEYQDVRMKRIQADKAERE